MGDKTEGSSLIVIFAVGRDRPGIVASLTEVLYQNGCNIEDSTMTILRGEFAMILTVTAPPKTSLQTLEKGIEQVGERLDLITHVKRVSEPKEAGKTASNRPYRITLYGTDHPGIVHRVSRCLADQEINITDLQTKTIAQKGETIYSMVIEVDIPEAKEIETIETKLQTIAEELKVTLDFNPIDTIPL